MPDEEDKGHYYDGRTLQPLPIPKHAFAQAVLNTSSPCSVGLCPQYSITGAAWLKGKGKGGKKKKKEDHRATLLCAKAHMGAAGAGDLPIQDLVALQLELRRRRDVRQAETRRCQAPC